MAFRLIKTLAAVVAATGLSQMVAAQWTVTNLNPIGAIESRVYGAYGTFQVGEINNGVQRAGFWNSTSLSWVSLHQGSSSRAFAMSGTSQAGFVIISSVRRASVWPSVAALRVDLHPAGAVWSEAYACTDTQQGGAARISNVTRAYLWNGAGGPAVNLNPTGSPESTVHAMNGSQQAGYFFVSGNQHACIWSGTATSVVDLHPTGSTQSVAYATTGTHQAGLARVNGAYHASLWNGTSASWIDLHPGVATSSEAHGAYGSHQVGWAFIGGASRASLWSGSSSTWVNLHAFLPANFTASTAEGISSDGTNLYITGIAYQGSSTPTAVLWVGNPAPNALLSGNVSLSDTVGSFVFDRALSYTLLQGTATIASGSITASASTTAFSIPVSNSISGPATLVLDGSPFLRRETNLVLTGSNVAMGSVICANGDVDNSGEVDATDIDEVIADFGDLTDNPADVDVSGEVDATDIDIVIASFGTVDD